jgi:hypothetical protein
MKNLSRVIMFAYFLLLIQNKSIGQAKKPTIMVIPSSTWCTKNKFITVVDNQGKKEEQNDYERAVRESTDLMATLTSIGGFFTKRGFEPKLLSSVLSTLKSRSAEEMLATNKSGAELSESPLDKLKKTAKADIVVEIDWEILQKGPYKYVNYISFASDAYTSKQIAKSNGVSEPDAASPVPLMIETAVLANMDNFLSDLQLHFDKLAVEGREVVLEIKKWDSFDGDLESEYDGKELNEIIENWVAENTVKGRFSLSDATENMMNFEQVKIPLYDEKGRANDTRSWAKGLQNFLKEKYKIDSKLTTRGLGNAGIVIGEK